MSFVEIALIINIVASMVTFYFARSSFKEINERQKSEACNNEKAEFLVLEERKLLNLLNTIIEKNITLDELKNLSIELKGYVEHRDSATMMKVALEALEKHKKA